MLNEAERLGVQIRLGYTVQGLDFNKTQVLLEDGEVLSADVVIGADGEFASG